MGDVSPRSSSDIALVIAVARREERALEDLFHRYAGQLESLARRVARDEQLAADVVQEVFVRLWERPERFDPERGSLRAFLLADTHGRAVDTVRSEVARRAREERDHAATPSGISASTGDEAMTRILAAEIRGALVQLSDDERSALELAYFGGHSYREVAELLGEPEGTVKSRIRASLVKLRALTTGARQ